MGSVILSGTVRGSGSRPKGKERERRTSGSDFVFHQRLSGGDLRHFSAFFFAPIVLGAPSAL